MLNMVTVAAIVFGLVAFTVYAMAIRALLAFESEQQIP
jgi:hypothetical protein